MDIQDDKDFAALLEVTKLYQACKERDLTIAEREYLKGARYAWQAAKASAVPDLSELQERIAGHQYYHDEHGHMVVDMDDVVKEISSFDSCKAQAVPEGFVLVPEEPTEKMIDAGVEETSVDWKRLVFGYKAMIEAQEPAND